MKSETVGHIGEIRNVVGTPMEASDGRSNIGDIVLVYDEEQNRQMPVEVVGFKDGEIQLMTYEATDGIASGSFVRNTRQHLKVPVGDFLKGRIINTMGRPIGGRNILHASQYYTVNSPYTNPLDRPSIHDRLEFGIRAVDDLNAIGEGQRIGIFAGPNVGKSILMGMVTKNARMDINVIALVGEHGREVLEFVQKDLGEEGMKRFVLVMATSDQSAMLGMKCPLIATTIAEYFRDQGFNVLLMMGSFTHCAMAQRETRLATGEPPIARGYTPSIYAESPKLLEWNSNFSQGSIIGVYMVLMEGDDTNGPIADTVKGILGGHIVLSRQPTNEDHFPTIDIGASVSRLIVETVNEEYRRISSRFCNMLSLYQKSLDLISIGAYKKGTNVVLDGAVSRINKMNAFLQQGIDERFPYERTLGFMEPIVG